MLDKVGGELTGESMAMLTSDEITLLAYCIMREEVMDGGLVQLIYEGRAFYEAHHEEIEREMSDEEFMALFEQFPEADDFDDTFIEHEEEITAEVTAHARNIGLI